MGSQTLSSKNQNSLWPEYLANEHEPKSSKTYDLTPELEEELLAHGVFLKQRVWRHMKRIRRQNARLAAHRQHKAHKPYRAVHFGHRHHLAHL